MENREIENKIFASRKISQDGSIVVYNLSGNIDFSHPKELANALSKVFFENDAKNWFVIEGNRIKFSPKYKVRILMDESNRKLLSATADDFLSDLKNEEIKNKFKKNIEDISTKEIKIQSAIGISAIASFLEKPLLKKDDKVEIEDQYFTEMLEYLEIRTPSDQDLIDWDNLPI
ncbi:MAG: hypothetical protein QXN66_05570 [Thermoplasmatales archaeon]